MAFQPVYVIVHLKRDARVLFQEVLIVIHEMHKTEEIETTTPTVRGDPSTDIVYIAVEFRQEKVYVFTTVKF